jgi:hypothetical protein
VRRAAPAAALLFGLAACASSPSVTVEPRRAPAGPDPVAVSRALAQAGEQVAGCYRSPKINRAARQIVTVLNVSYLPDGSLANSPVLRSQSGLTETNSVYAGQMARAAIEAVERCVPLRLPPELYKGGWDAFDLTFSPRGLA